MYVRVSNCCAKSSFIWPVLPQFLKHIYTISKTYISAHLLERKITQAQAQAHALTCTRTCTCTCIRAGITTLCMCVCVCVSCVSTQTTSKKQAVGFFGVSILDSRFVELRSDQPAQRCQCCGGKNAAQNVRDLSIKFPSQNMI